MCFLPWRGEFGMMLMCFVRWVHAYEADVKVVCCRKGDEPLFPSAQAFVAGWNEPDDVLKNTDLLRSREHWQYLAAFAARLRRRLPGFEMVFPFDGKGVYLEEPHPEWNFRPKPNPESIAGLKPGDGPDVLLAPRGRKFAAVRNYRHWGEVARGLLREGLRVGLLGVRDTSQDLPGIREQDKAWSHADNLSYTLWAMNGGKLTLSIDSAMAHLAVLNGTPLKVICGKPGEVPHTQWRWNVPHMQAHAIAHCEPLLHAWEDPQAAVDATLRFVRGSSRRSQAVVPT